MLSTYVILDILVLFIKSKLFEVSQQNCQQLASMLVKTYQGNTMAIQSYVCLLHWAVHFPPIFLGFSFVLHIPHSIILSVILRDT